MEKIKMEIEVGYKNGNDFSSIIPKMFVGNAEKGNKKFELSTTWGQSAIIIKDEQNGNQYVISFESFLEALSNKDLI